MKILLITSWIISILQIKAQSMFGSFNGYSYQGNNMDKNQISEPQMPSHSMSDPSGGDSGYTGITNRKKDTFSTNEPQFPGYQYQMEMGNSQNMDSFQKTADKKPFSGYPSRNEVNQNQNKNLNSNEQLPSESPRGNMFRPNTVPETNNVEQEENKNSTNNITRHIYFHAAPPEMEESMQQNQPSVGPRRKHYTIIFIKAPGLTKSQSQLQFAPPKNEEKTIVYVLVKKNEDASSVNVPSAAASPPSKPEVFFIKYKEKKSETNPSMPKTKEESKKENDISYPTKMNQGYNYEKNSN